MSSNRLIDITGQQFGDLTVIKLSDKKNKYGHTLWECKCSCGNTTYVMGSSLRAGHYKSCGCKRDKRRDRGMRQHLNQDAVNGTRKSALKAKMHKHNKSGHKGVIWLKDRKRWRAYIGFKGKQIHLGHFKELDDAIKARQDAEKKYHKPILEDSNDER